MQQNLGQNFRPECIPTMISGFHPNGEVPVLDKTHFDGGQCRIYRVNFRDGTSWAVRIPIHVKSNHQDKIIAFFQGERDVLQEVNRIAFPWAPTLHGSSLSFNNLVGFPIIALSWVEGSPLSWSATFPCRPIRNKVLVQVAEIQRCLIERTIENSPFNHPVLNCNC